MAAAWGVLMSGVTHGVKLVGHVPNAIQGEPFTSFVELSLNFFNRALFRCGVKCIQ